MTPHALLPPPDDRATPEQSRVVRVDAGNGNAASPTDSRRHRPSIAEIAALSTARIMAMPRGELAAVVRSVRRSHLRAGVSEQLDRMDAATLRRLVFATRRYCRGQALLAAEIWPDMRSCPR